VSRPGDGARSDAPERVARPHDARHTTGFLHDLSCTVWPAFDLPSHQQPEQAVLSRTGQKLIDQDLTVPEGEQRTARKKLRSEATGRLELDQTEPSVVGESDAGGTVGSQGSSPCDSTRVACENGYLMAARPSRSATHRRRRSAAWPIVLIFWVVGGFSATGPAAGQVSTPPTVPPVLESDVAECARREAVAASIAKLDSARATKTPFEELLRQVAEIEKRMLELKPDTGRTCQEDFSIVGLSERFDPIRQELLGERRRQDISRKSWPEHIKLAVLENRVELGMTREQVKAAVGEPRNVDVTPTTRQEQWTYSGPTYLYFTDGALAMIARTNRPRD